MSSFDVELIDIVKDFESGGSRVRAVDRVSVQVEDGEFFALLGPSGCGKTTTLRLIAGFEQPSSGRVLIRGRAMEGIPAYHRPVNTVFQDYALFPHLTVEQNVMFGLQMEGVEKREARKRAGEALDLVRLPGVGSRKPHQLSGGQQQRVALARALVKQPAVLLLDEPLGALDLKLRQNMQVELKALQRDVGITFIYVTHDQEEAITMADRIAVMNDGLLLQVGSPKEIYERPRTRFVADFIGETNFLPGKLLRRLPDGRGEVRLATGDIVAAAVSQELQSSGDVILAIRPERVRIEPAGDSAALDDGETRLEGVLVESQYIGTDTRLTARVGERLELVSRRQNTERGENAAFAPGQPVRVSWHQSSATILDSSSPAHTIFQAGRRGDTCLARAPIPIPPETNL